MREDKKSQTPRLLRDADVTQLPLGPSEGFVLSRIDGEANVAEIADMTGLGVDKVLDVVGILLAHGVAEWVVGGTPRPRHSYVRMPTPSRGIIRTKPPPPGASRALYDPQELEEPDVDMDIERRRTILDTFYRLDEMTFYDLLAVEPSAPKKEVRHAYFRLSKLFHPDSLYGKRLGTYKRKMVEVFKRLTEAYDVLGKERTRREYDAYIKLRVRTGAAQERLAEGRREAARIEREVSHAAGSAVVHPDSVEGEGRGVEASPSSSAPPASADARSSSHPARREIPDSDRPMSAEAKERQRRLVARKIAAATRRQMPVRGRVSSSPPAGSGSAPPPPSRDDLLHGLARSLKRAAALTGGVDKVQMHVAAAKQAEGEGNLVAASNSLRLAVALDPDDAEIQKAYARTRHALAVSLADSYEQQAKYEERMGRWQDASVSWGRVCEGRPEDARVHAKAALCILEAQGDLAKAKGFAQKAVDLQPNRAIGHRALGRVFHAAGMKLNARRELERVLELDPGDEIVKNLLRELGR